MAFGWTVDEGRAHCTAGFVVYSAHCRICFGSRGLFAECPRTCTATNNLGANSVVETLAGVLGGFGLFAVGLSLLSENLKAVADRRLRLIAKRWTGNRVKAYGWGIMLGLISQSAAASTFISVGLLRSGLVSTVAALALLMGSYAGLTILVVVVTLDVEVFSLYAIGLAGIAIIGSRNRSVRTFATAIFGGALMILGLVLLKEAAAPLAQQPWFDGAIAWAHDSLWLIFLVSAVLTFLVQSTAVVCVLGVTLASVGVLGVNETLMLVYGSCAGSGALVYLLSLNIRGRARQVAMYTVLDNVMVCFVFVPLLLIEVYFDIPLVRALVLSVNAGLQQQLALVYVLVGVALAPFMLAVLGPTARLLERLWPATQVEHIGHTRFIHDRAIVDLATSVALADLEQRRILTLLPRYLESVREDTQSSELREAVTGLLSETQAFLSELCASREAHTVEARAVLLIRQSLLVWLEEHLAALCAALLQLNDGSSLRASIVEGVDAVLLCLIEAVETDDDELWNYVRSLTAERSEPMRKVRAAYSSGEHPHGDREATGSVIAVTSSVEQVFVILDKLAREFDNSPEMSAATAGGRAAAQMA